jgi:hypothetical protein
MELCNLKLCTKFLKTFYYRIGNFVYLSVKLYEHVNYLETYLTWVCFTVLIVMNVLMQTELQKDVSQESYHILKFIYHL